MQKCAKVMSTKYKFPESFFDLQFLILANSWDLLHLLSVWDFVVHWHEGTFCSIPVTWIHESQWYIYICIFIVRKAGFLWNRKLWKEIYWRVSTTCKQLLLSTSEIGTCPACRKIEKKVEDVLNVHWSRTQKVLGGKEALLFADRCIQRRIEHFPKFLLRLLNHSIQALVWVVLA